MRCDLGTRTAGAAPFVEERFDVPAARNAARGRHYAVFLHNKIGSCDAILPLMMEVHRLAPDSRIEFITFDQETYDILKENTVLWDGVHSIGTLACWDRTEPGLLGWLKHRAVSVWRLGRLAWLGLVGRARFLHVKALVRWPLRLLYLLNRRGTFQVEAAAYGYPAHVERLVEARKTRPKPAPIPTGNLVVFDPDHWKLAHPVYRGVPRFSFDWPRTRKVWLDFVRDRADGYFEREFARAGIAPRDEVIAYVFGTIDAHPQMRHPDTLRRLIGETLDILLEAGGGRPILMKPHFEKDVAVFEEEIAARPGADIMVTHLHAGVLATRARVLVCNLFTTTMADGFTAGVPTIEYGDYSDEMLELSGNRSFWPDFITHFISHDAEAFRRVLADIMGRPRPEHPPEGRTGDTSGLLDALTAPAGAASPGAPAADPEPQTR